MITTDQEFMDAILKLNLNVWTLPELTFKFSQDTDCTVNIQIFENGNDKFQNDKGIKFFIMFDSISREAFMSIFKV
jgi:hypothetical protein